MLTNDDLKEIRKRAEDPVRFSVANPDWNPSDDTLALLAEIERLRRVHTEEQRRSADRLRAALSNGESRMIDEGNPNV